jgi:hypothetical protein
MTPDPMSTICVSTWTVSPTTVTTPASIFSMPSFVAASTSESP